MNNYNFNTKTYNTILNEKYDFKTILLKELKDVETFKFYKKDLAILFVTDDYSYDKETYDNQELSYIDEFITDYLNSEKNDIEFTNNELKEFLIFSETKKIPDDMNYNIIKKYTELYNSETNDYLDISEIEYK